MKPEWCPQCEEARHNAKAAGHRSWATGVCFDHAGLSLEDWVSSLPPQQQQQIQQAAKEGG